MSFNELSELEYKIKKVIESEDNLNLQGFLTLPSKRLRPRVIFLILKMLGLEIKDEHINLALAVELLHGATLIHDDVLDDAKLRRGKNSINADFGSKLAVLGGDYLLSVALYELSKIKRYDIFEIFSENISKMVNGEINQYFERGKIPTLDEYIKKNIEKTALLFLSGVKSALLISNYNEHIEEIENFTLNFGLAFQILNDLQSKEDIKNQTYTINNILRGSKKDLNCDSIKVGKEFLYKIINKANGYLNFIQNEYKDELCKLIFSLEEK